VSFRVRRDAENQVLMSRRQFGKVVCSSVMVEEINKCSSSV
jgi:hypothetical protein